MKQLSNYDKVRQFTAAMGQPLDWRGNWTLPPDGPNKLEEFRFDLIREEFEEAEKAETPENMLKELCDLVYVVLGYCATFGLDFDTAFNRVHASNMSKLGDDGKPVCREDGKVLKSKNYKPADLSDLV
jgi:NTP pyrophosphatase (non-canonical NTP hydrolase)